MISNPCNFSIDGSNYISFIYEGGKELYHFSPHYNGLDTHMGCNLVFFADSEEHGLDVLRRMFELAIDCREKCAASYKKNDSFYYGESNLEQARKYLQALKDGKIKLTKAPMNQMYKVGWAANDTVI